MLQDILEEILVFLFLRQACDGNHIYTVAHVMHVHIYTRIWVQLPCSDCIITPVDFWTRTAELELALLSEIANGCLRLSRTHTKFMV